MTIARLTNPTRISGESMVARASSYGAHVEALDWQTRVIANGGSVSLATLWQVSVFCNAIDTAGIRGKFYRLNLFVGTGLSAALVPLFRSTSYGGTTYGNSTDTNSNFVSGDYNETGSSSGLTGNGSTKWLDTGVLANAFTASDSHLGVGLRVAESGAGYKTVIGAYTGSSNSFCIDVQNSGSVRYGCAYFTRFGTNGDCVGNDVGPGSALAAGDLVAAYSAFYRNGSATGRSATSSQNYPSAHKMAVFANYNGGTSAAINHTNARINWYSIGLTMTSAQVSSFNTAISNFNTALSRT